MCREESRGCDQQRNPTPVGQTSNQCPTRSRDDELDGMASTETEVARRTMMTPAAAAPGTRSEGPEGLALLRGADGGGEVGVLIESGSGDGLASDGGIFAAAGSKQLLVTVSCVLEVLEGAMASSMDGPIDSRRTRRHMAQLDPPHGYYRMLASGSRLSLPSTDSSPCAQDQRSCA